MIARQRDDPRPFDKWLSFARPRQNVAHSFAEGSAPLSTKAAKVGSLQASISFSCGVRLMKIYYFARMTSE
jgi:hypothetical protein